MCACSMCVLNTQGMRLQAFTYSTPVHQSPRLTCLPASPRSLHFSLHKSVCRARLQRRHPAQSGTNSEANALRAQAPALQNVAAALQRHSLWPVNFTTWCAHMTGTMPCKCITPCA